MENESLRKSVKILRVTRDLDFKGSLGIIADAINENRNSLSMALTGYRNGPGTKAILEKAKAYLSVPPGESQ